MNRLINRKKIFYLSLIGLLASITLHAQEKFPVPTGNSNQLFYLQRNPNTNTIVYEVNYEKNTINAEDPVHVYWIRYNEQGQQEELNFIQRKFAYGLKSTLIAKDKYQLHFVSYKKFPMFLIKGANNKYNVFATINQKQAILNRIFVKISGGSFWTPNVEYVEVKGIDPATGKEVMERMKI
ncbi:DUF4833 domain-containing protein [Segetibacter koreensis]|uniref:DUF4833 domain-containing protein n=1 Tax=Segetibacter koreensis TaxID=398037 RepID=UPI000381B67A|nr:DUF4833 domain-containing protein [Segetibacter koreensis]